MGKLRGRTEDGIHVFTAFRTAQIHPARTAHAAAKPSSWTGMRDAIEWGHVAPQPLPSGNYDYTHGSNGRYSPAERRRLPGLNVCTPALKDGGKRAVMFSIHGGGYTTGTSHNPVFDGRALAHHGDVVVVTVNHRLGALGYLNLAEFAPEFAQSGVVGMMDLSPPWSGFATTLKTSAATRAVS